MLEVEIKLVLNPNILVLNHCFLIFLLIFNTTFPLKYVSALKFLPFSPCSIQANKTLDAGDNPALKKVNEGSVNLVRGGKHNTNFRSGVSNKLLVNSYNAETING